MNRPIQSVCVLGRQPALGLAELESLYGAESLIAVTSHVAGLSLVAEDIDFGRLGSSTKLAKVLAMVPRSDWNSAEKELIKLARSSALIVPSSGKFHLGLSAYGFDASPAKLTALGLTLKKIIRSRGVSVRTVPNVEVELNTAQVYHNHLSDKHGAELLIVRTNDGQTIIARTVAVQDIDSYTLRDRGRPKRDARVGMLPPKLAQTIINLAVGQIGADGRWHMVDGETQNPLTILDPFCGTGVVLQEALLMGYTAYGTDLEPRMVDYSRHNIEWLAAKFELPDLKLEVGDATTHTWQLAEVYVAGETYLGRPFTAPPPHDLLEQTISDTNLILKKFLVNIHGQLAPKTRLCLAMPAWFISKQREPRHLPVLNLLNALGYERISFKHTAANDLVYHREDQIVGRELVVITKK
ncbi:hypothetical protein JNM87_05255 [Candidatus Saccharibacteria bacterium]|nr:hypothetical protein [Candidatus Saccharibacteria bacterium]